MTPSEEKVTSILTQIKLLNECKSAVARKVIDALDEIASISAKIGELQASLKEQAHGPVL